MSSVVVQKKIHVTGVVQGVGYRYFAYKNAHKFKIKGYARNMLDGSVLVVAQGEKAPVSNYISLLREGPVAASIDSVEIEDCPVEEYDRFSTY
ncbi:MAG: acylphosphatase [Candidatus Margulisiibacteriota bacterium]|nr:MAG: hypothetical protein A2X43_07760 [Candidatus Margulisbacteria bacterium GWD2_39_127]OGI03882.1 MAG: hypothetical protein A2X42_09975 [Candidatus Margulisbacteria bacterium GWF2_38_17]OGI08813.1 MAG: hypothetical protein A2X41_05140 [Candidatus Margulisbacteria bacterium GWE2_39_32]PZM78644.1 MAG: acylphosphatase [Candidatus Margulisiibacteriota bacterium]HAR61986.1 acylphosphatase [Candidatus Margulisiibacteriota bacterium]